jgi:hypothetical protein
MVEGTDNPVGTATSCTYYPSLLVTPPNLTRPKKVIETLSGSSIPASPGAPASESTPWSPEPRVGSADSAGPVAAITAEYEQPLSTGGSPICRLGSEPLVG